MKKFLTELGAGDKVSGVGIFVNLCLLSTLFFLIVFRVIARG